MAMPRDVEAITHHHQCPQILCNTVNLVAQPSQASSTLQTSSTLRPESCKVDFVAETKMQCNLDHSNSLPSVKNHVLIERQSVVNSDLLRLEILNKTDILTLRKSWSTGTTPLNQGMMTKGNRSA